MDIMANKADTSFKNQLVLKSVIGDQIVALYEVMLIPNVFFRPSKPNGNALFQDGKKHFEACLAKYGKNVPV
ncbi:hypothetical protein MPER_04809 [Moniliophthora perniciosa FA553]|nr:hypothetical protein MPER_04809 [Moniliophthora perniciosa FA553]